MLNSSLMSIQNLRNNFANKKEEAIGLAKKWGITPEFEKKRHRKVRQFFDDFNADEKLQVRERLYEVDVFKANVDVITIQLKNRFESMNGIYKSFSFLFPKNIVSTTNDLFIMKPVIFKKYSLDLSSEFPNQIMSLKAVFSEDLIKLNSIKDLGNFSMIQKFAAPSLPDVCITVFLFLTLPVTSAMAERSFSKLKLIKNYLRCTMSEERLSYLSLINIEQQETRKIELDELITDFAKKNVTIAAGGEAGRRLVILSKWTHNVPNGYAGSNGYYKELTQRWKEQSIRAKYMNARRYWIRRYNSNVLTAALCQRVKRTSSTPRCIFRHLRRWSYVRNGLSHVYHLLHQVGRVDWRGVATDL
ncbi:uncharacterized protein TNCV_41821 [Trichonephila clavipes]|nr:uncharacterized protein TNCV_41821 [Trichonephila clavipes]